MDMEIHDAPFVNCPHCGSRVSRIKLDNFRRGSERKEKWAHIKLLEDMLKRAKEDLKV
jgi:hypothetical protein